VTRWLRAVLAAAVTLAAPLGVRAQAADVPVLDSIEVVGQRRLPPSQILAMSGLAAGQTVTYRDLQRAIRALYASGQFADVRMSQGAVDGRALLRIEVVEHLLLRSWSVQGVEAFSERAVRGRIRLRESRPYDPVEAYRAVAAIDSLYRQGGYYLTTVHVIQDTVLDGQLEVTFAIDEGRKVAISQVIVEGNAAVPDDDVVGSMKTSPEGFWWFQKGQYDERELERDLRERIPNFYAERGYVDLRIVRDTLVVAEGTGKATLVVTVEEGPRYAVGRFEIIGNRRFSSEQLEAYYPFGDQRRGFLGFGGTRDGPAVFDEARWRDATGSLSTLYANNGYLYARVEPMMNRRVADDGAHVVDLRWQIQEGVPATIRRIDIAGNSVTHEDVIRRATFPLVPGDIFRQDALIRAYQNVTNLGFFEQPVAIPDVQPANQEGDVDLIFRVEERRTGNINFGASVGQGTGVGGFIGLDEPNVMGRGKRVAVQWQFGSNISDINVTYSDPAIRGGLLSGSLNLHSTRLRYTIADLGRIRTRGGSTQIGFPLFGARYTRLFTSYTLEQSTYDSPSLSSVFVCENCTLSQVALSVNRDTRIELPFPTGGALHEVRIAQAGGPLGGTGNFQRATFEGRWYAPLTQFGGNAPGSSPLKVVLGLTSKAGFVWGDPGPHFRQLFSLGGTQFGVPLRGYDEFSVTPRGFDPQATGFRANTVDAFGRAYFAATGELGLRVSQALYLAAFYDAGNVWNRPAQFNPTRLFRGAGLGVSVVSPLGPLGLDYAYGFDRTDADGNPTPGWKFHFKLGNFF
jgi:outer membrane protein insertion porin family